MTTCSGSLGPIFSKDNRAPLVRDSYFLFRPKGAGGTWGEVDKAIRNHSLYEAIDREDVRREIAYRDDTWSDRNYKGRRVAISCAFEDRPTVIRVIRDLQNENQRYRILLDSLLGLGNTALENSRRLIQDAEAVLVIASLAYILSAVQKPGGNIDAEVKEIYAKNTPKADTKVVVLAVDPYETLKSVPNWSWTKLNPKWVPSPPILFPTLRHAGEATLRDAVQAAVKDLNGTTNA